MQPARTRTRGKRERLPVNNVSASIAATAAPRRRRKGPMPACKQSECGLLVEVDEEEKRVCHACRRPQGGPNMRWKHFLTESVDDAIRLYERDANNRRLCESGGVKGDYRPSCKCVCDRGGCVCAVVKGLNVEDAKKDLCRLSEITRRNTVEESWAVGRCSHFTFQVGEEFD